MREKNIIERLRENVDYLKRQIVVNIKTEIPMVRKIRKVPLEADRDALNEQLAKMHHETKAYQQALDDLAIAFVKSRPTYGERIARKFGYKTIEGFLKDKEAENAPDLADMINLVVNYTIYIPEVYYVGRYPNGEKAISRNFDLLKKMSVTPLHDPLELEAPTGNIHKDVHNAKETESIIASGASHR